MIEGGVILVVFLVSALIYLGARVQSARDRLSPREEVAHLQERLAWHEAQLRLAREHKWDDVMVANIREQLTATRYRLAGLQVDQAGEE